MTILMTLSAVLAAALFLALKASAITWIAGATGLCAILFGTGTLGAEQTSVLAMIMIVVGLLLGPTPLRRQLLGRASLAYFQRVKPRISDTEREALEAGDVWWEADLFRGAPEWQKLREMPAPGLTPREQAFLDVETARLCAMLDDWKISQEDKDLPAEVWQFLREKGFFGMLIGEEHGGLGFSAYAQSCVVTRIASRSVTAAVTVMVPNSLGPGELLVHYGTDEQKEKWLPRLVSGAEIPCFGLTSPEAGSDAGSIPDEGIVTRGRHEGRDVLGIRLTFEKRWITLAPVATIVGLAFKLRDPDGLLGDPEKSEYGITCALIPADHAGIEIGRRHYPGAFMNGPVSGTDVFIPLDWIIGGPTMAGRGWAMLMECLSAGRGVSLPALSAAATKVSYRMSGAFSRIRRQFGVAVGEFEGVQEANARIAGLTYITEASRRMTCAGLDETSPAVVSAIAKLHMTEMMRDVVSDASDVHGGRAVQMGPRNYLASVYQSVPIAITVEGANILTRSLMVFGQGAIRCHPYVLAELEAAELDDGAEALRRFDRVFFAHLMHIASNGLRAFWHAITGSRFARGLRGSELHPEARQLTRRAAALAFAADIAMAMLGDQLKRRERLSARLGDVLSHLYMASGVIRMYHEHADAGEPELHLARWSLRYHLARIDEAFAGLLQNMDGSAGLLIRAFCFPLGVTAREPSDRLGTLIARDMMQPSALRDALTQPGYFPMDAEDVTGRMDVALEMLEQIEPAYVRFLRSLEQGYAVHRLEHDLERAVIEGVISAAEAEQIRRYDALRRECLATDAFERLPGVCEQGGPAVLGEAA